MGGVWSRDRVRKLALLKAAREEAVANFTYAVGKRHEQDTIPTQVPVVPARSAVSEEQIAVLDILVLKHAIQIVNKEGSSTQRSNLLTAFAKTK